MLKEYCMNCNAEWVSNGTLTCPECGLGVDLIKEYNAPPIALLNTSIATVDGTYTLNTIFLDQAKSLITNQDTLSAIGHDSTAQILSDLLGVNVPVNRINFEQQVGQIALVFKLNGRAPEGKVLSREEIEQIGYSFKLLVRSF